MDRRIAAALVSALALGVASCGSTEPQLTRTQLVAKINVACREAAKATSQQTRSGLGTTASPNRAALAAALIAGQHVLEDRLAGLTPPDAAKQEFEAFRTEIQQRLHVYEQMQATFRSGAQTTSSKLQQQNFVLFHRLDGISHHWELQGCI